MHTHADTTTSNAASSRLLALDILRGVTVAGMILVNNPGSWEHVYAPLRHAEWNGLTPADLVFPFFMFIMGISTYISLGKRGFARDPAALRKIARRSVLIFATGLAVGWFSRFCSYWASAPGGAGFWQDLWNASWNFGHMRVMGVMQRLAVCYCAAAAAALCVKHSRIPWVVAALLGGYWILLAAGNGFAYDETNILSAADRAVFTPAHMYKDNGIDPEGLLSTIPSVAHVLLGFCVGRMALGGGPARGEEELGRRILRLLLAGAALAFAGLLLSYGCPLNKKVWSPSFVLVTCGMASSLLGLLAWVVDVKGRRRWSLFFEAFGVNPLFMYVLGGVLGILFGSVRLPWGGGASVRGLLYGTLAPLFGETGGSLAYAAAFVAVNWCVGYQLYKRKIYIKI